jgi:uncharacterized lipoprotein YmbA
VTHRACRLRAAARATLAVAVLAPSCMLRPLPDPTRFYVLAARAPNQPPAPGAPVVGLGPITMPGYLQHSKLATRVDGTQIRYADFDRWAEPLPTLFGRVLGQDLSALLGARIVASPWYRTTPLDVVVRVDVASFESDAAGTATLAACWTVRSAPAKAVCSDDCSSIVEAADDPGAQALVAALGRAVGELAQQLARAIRSCPRREVSPPNDCVRPASRRDGSRARLFPLNGGEARARVGRREPRAMDGCLCCYRPRPARVVSKTRFNWPAISLRPTVRLAAAPNPTS